ncbi:MAG: hypothetical protein ACRC57_01670 [Sarcina sp.]
MRNLSYKKTLIYVIFVSIIYLSINIFLTSLAYFNVFNSRLYSFFNSATVLPILLLAIILQGIYNSIPKNQKLLKALVIFIFIVLLLISVYINTSILKFATL